MGRDKAALPFAGEPLLARVVRLLGEAVPLHALVVVAGRHQPLPSLPGPILVIRDSGEAGGPLPAVAAGLRALPPDAAAALVTACDAPLLQPALLERLFSLLDREPSADAVVPRDEQRLYALTAVYRAGAAAALERAIARGERSLQRALASEAFRAVAVEIEALRDVDPQLASFTNCNTPEELAAAQQIARGGQPGD